jgi:hypothetical protein
MCVYCFIADWMHKYVPDYPSPTVPLSPHIVPGTVPVTTPNTIPPQTPYPAPSTPVGGTPLPWSPQPVQPWPTTPTAPLWTQEQLDEAMEILRKVKEMEDALGGCPCEDASKLDFLNEIQARLDRLKEDRDGESVSDAHPISE